MTWQDHPGDTVGVRIQLTPPAADPIKFHVFVALPLATGSEPAGKLPEISWQSTVNGAKQPLVLGNNVITFPEGDDCLVLSMKRSVERQVNLGELQTPAVEHLQFKVSAPENPTNLPNFQERQYDLKFKKLNNETPVVASSVTINRLLVNADVVRVTADIVFSRKADYDQYLVLHDILNQFLDGGTLSRVSQAAIPEGSSSLALANTLNQTSGEVRGKTLRVFMSSATDLSTRLVAVPAVYPHPRKPDSAAAYPYCWLFPKEMQAIRFQFEYDRDAVNTAIFNGGKPQGWERVFLTLLKKWEGASHAGKNHRSTTSVILRYEYTPL